MTREQAEAMTAVLHEVAEERQRQHQRWGEQNLPDGTGPDYRAEARVAREWCVRAQLAGRVTFLDILREEVFEAFEESDPAKLRAELIQVCAVACQWVECLDRRHPGARAEEAERRGDA